MRVWGKDTEGLTGMQKIARAAALVLLNLIMVGLLLELGLRLLGPNLPGLPGIAARYVVSGQPYAQEWTPAWTQNRDHYYALRPGVVDALQYGSPSVAFRMSTIELWEGGGIGFRTRPVDYFVDAVVVGDSFSMCFTEQVDCWVDQWAARSGLGVVNLGQPVTGSVSHGRILRDFGAPLTPPLVIWQFFGNDFNDDYGLAVWRDEIAPVEEEASASAEEAGGLLDGLRRSSAAFAVIETALSGRIAGLPQGEILYEKPVRVLIGAQGRDEMRVGGLYELQALDMSREANQIGLELSTQAFAQAQALVAGWGGELVLLLVPTREEVYARWTEPALGAEWLEKLASARAAMRELCAQLDLRCYDPTAELQALAEAGEILYYADDMHFNAAGNARLAELLHAYLAAEGLLPGDS